MYNISLSTELFTIMRLWSPGFSEIEQRRFFKIGSKVIKNDSFGTGARVINAFLSQDCPPLDDRHCLSGVVPPRAPP
jgi:hypothetical protein